MTVSCTTMSCESVSCTTMSCESSLMMIWHMPSEMELEGSSINALYLAILFVDRPIQIPLKLTNLPLGVKMAHVVEDRFYIPNNNYKRTHTWMKSKHIYSEFYYA